MDRIDAHPSTDEGLGNVGRGDESGLAPDDDGIGNIRPEQSDLPKANEAGIGNVPAGAPTGHPSSDEGLGNVRRPDPA